MLNYIITYLNQFLAGIVNFAPNKVGFAGIGFGDRVVGRVDIV